MNCIFDEETQYLEELSKENIAELKKLDSDGNMIGYIYTRDPFTGARTLAGKYSSQGGNFKDIHLLKLDNEFLYRELIELGKILEKKSKDMEKIYFSIENGEIKILKNYSGERTSKAVIKMAIDFVEDDILTIAESLERIREIKISPKFIEKLEKTMNSSEAIVDNFERLYLDGLRKNLKRLLFWADTYEVELFESCRG
ncbi:MAG: hypothetical protein ACRCRV_06810 [Cetobacterium sp.]